MDVARSLDIKDLQVLLKFLVINREVEGGLVLYLNHSVVAQSPYFVFIELVLEAQDFKFLLHKLIDLLLNIF